MPDCIACGKSLASDVTIVKGVGPVCRAPLLIEAERRLLPQCAYRAEFLYEEKIVLIHEIPDYRRPKVSLTNCIEQVINEIVKEYGVCTSLWAFVEHTDCNAGLPGGYEEYDLVLLSGKEVDWRYLWHSDAPGETKALSKQLIIDKVKDYREKEKLC